MSHPLGARVIAQNLHDLGVTVIFGLVGLPVTDIAEQAINLGIRFIGFRNEQAASYAATAYGYLTGQPGICLLVGGPGVVHGLAGVVNASANAWPALFLGGSSETYLWTKGGFQEMDAISLLTPQTKRAIRPGSNRADVISAAITDAYRASLYGRPGPTFVDLPTDLIMAPVSAAGTIVRQRLPRPPRPAAPQEDIDTLVKMLKEASSPLVIIGKGAAYARAEDAIRKLIDAHNLPFLPTPMGKGVVPESHPRNTSSARSVALREADVVLLLGARLNWILHYAASPKYRKDVKLIQVDIAPEELGRSNNLGQPSLSIFGDIKIVATQLLTALEGWRAFSQSTSASSEQPGTYLGRLHAASLKNEQEAHAKAVEKTKPGSSLTFERAFHIIKETLHTLSPPSEGGLVYIGEGSQTMDISRSIFPLERPRQKLDAGTNATMGAGLAYCIAAYAAYNIPQRTKKIVAFEGDSALGFAAMEVETMRRHDMDVLIFCMNNSGIYNGDTEDEKEWNAMREGLTKPGARSASRLKSSSLWYDTRYEQLAQMVKGRGIYVRTESELEQATVAGFKEDRVTVINVVIEAGVGKSISFAWHQAKEKAKI